MDKYVEINFPNEGEDKRPRLDTRILRWCERHNFYGLYYFLEPLFFWRKNDG